MCFVSLLVVWLLLFRFLGCTIFGTYVELEMKRFDCMLETIRFYVAALSTISKLVARLNCHHLLRNLDFISETSAGMKESLGLYFRNEC